MVTRDVGVISIGRVPSASFDVIGSVRIWAHDGQCGSFQRSCHTQSRLARLYLSPSQRQGPLRLPRFSVPSTGDMPSSLVAPPHVEQCTFHGTRSSRDRASEQRPPMLSWSRCAPQAAGSPWFRCENSCPCSGKAHGSRWAGEPFS